MNIKVSKVRSEYETKRMEHNECTSKADLCYTNAAKMAEPTPIVRWVNLDLCLHVHFSNNPACDWLECGLLHFGAAPPLWCFFTFKTPFTKLVV